MYIISDEEVDSAWVPVDNLPSTIFHLPSTIYNLPSTAEFEGESCKDPNPTFNLRIPANKTFRSNQKDCNRQSKENFNHPRKDWVEYAPRGQPYPGQKVDM